MDETKLEVGQLIHTLTQLSATATKDANIVEVFKPYPYIALPEGTTITAAQVIEQCEGQAPQNIVSGYSVEPGLTFTPVPRPS